MVPNLTFSPVANKAMHFFCRKITHLLISRYPPRPSKFHFKLWNCLNQSFSQETLRNPHFKSYFPILRTDISSHKSVIFDGANWLLLSVLWKISSRAIPVLIFISKTVYYDNMMAGINNEYQTRAESSVMVLLKYIFAKVH